MNNALKGLEHLALRVKAREWIEWWLKEHHQPDKHAYECASDMFKFFECKEFDYHPIWKPQQDTLTYLIIAYRTGEKGKALYGDLYETSCGKTKESRERDYNLYMEGSIRVLISCSAKLYTVWEVQVPLEL